MKKHYCNYELSQLAKQAGFDEECQYIYYFYSLVYCSKPFTNNRILVTPLYDKNLVTAPELTKLQQWILREFKVWIYVKQQFINKIKGTFGYVYEWQNNATYIFELISHEPINCPYNALQEGMIVFLTHKQNEK